MTSAWEFIKRHKGKIVIAGVVVGAAVSVKKALESDLFETIKYGRSDITIVDEKLSQSRKHFIFDSHQQSCDKQILELLSVIKSTIQQRFNVEELVERLKNSTDLSPKEKVQIWEEIKVNSFARILAVSFIYPLVAIVFKTQKSIICRENCKKYENQHDGSQKNSLLNYACSYIWPKESKPRTDNATDPKVQQLFMNCTQFFTTSGINQLFDRIQHVCEELVANLLLNKPVSLNDVKILLEKTKTKVQMLYGSKNFSDLVVPQRNIQGSFNVLNTSHLETLLSNFSDVLQTNTCCQLLSTFTEQYINSTKEILIEDLTENPVPLAKALPVLADSFSNLSKTKIDSIVHRILTSHELYRFTLLVFSTDDYAAI